MSISYIILQKIAEKTWQKSFPLHDEYEEENFFIDNDNNSEFHSSECSDYDTTSDSCVNTIATDVTQTTKSNG